MSMNKKEVLNELYDRSIVTTGTVGLSMAAKKIGGCH